MGSDELLTRMVVYELPGMQAVRVSKDVAFNPSCRLDVYHPLTGEAGSPGPTVIFVPGDAPEEIIQHAKEWGQYTSWGRLAAVSGIIANCINHRSTEGFTKTAAAASDVDDAVSYVRCVVAYYGIMDLREARARLPPEVDDKTLEEFSCLYWIGQNARVPPMLIARAGRDAAPINRTIDAFVNRAIAQNATIEFMNHPRGQHGFDVRDDDPRSKYILARTLKFLREHL
jgi:hypothetical protein